MKLIISCIFVGLFSIAAFAAPLCTGNHRNAALVIIDMQPNFVTRNRYDVTPLNKIKVAKLNNAQLAAIKEAKKNHIPIVFIEYAKHGETNSVLKAAVANYSDVSFIQKSTDGMFETSNTYLQELKDYLTKKQIGTLVIMGANGGACVLKSIKGALVNKCSVVAYDKGIADFNYPQFIYPFEYSKMSVNCKDCLFKEVFAVPDFVPYMAKQNGVAPKANNRTATGVN